MSIDKIGKLLEEYESGGEIQEAFRCIKELGMPFFHHEVVKKALVSVMEKKNENELYISQIRQEVYKIISMFLKLFRIIHIILCIQ